MKGKILGLLAVGLLAGPMAAQAAVIYSFTGARTATYTHPSFITTDVVQCEPASGIDCSGINFYPNFEAFPAYDTVQFATSTVIGEGSTSLYLIFANNAFGSTGVYESIGGGLVVTLTVSTDSSPVPEPGTLALLCLCLVGLGVSRRRKAN